MEISERLKNARNLLLKLHKSMLDLEREMYEGLNGPLTPAQYVNLLIEDEDFAWLRKFSMLIVEIDEMFASKAGIEPGMIEANFFKVKELVEMREPDEYFKAKYQFALQKDPNAASLQSELKSLFD